jgi:hypothetical protein
MGGVFLQKDEPMETKTPLSPSALSPTELEQLRPAIAARYPDAKGVLGSQLGAFVRRHLTNPDLKGRFGGLKGFVGHYFPAEIIWSGRKGLDDLYDISFAAETANRSTGAWQTVSLEPVASLWSAVTNPSIYVQFAWSAKEQSLLQSSAGVPPVEGLAVVEKLTKTDYQNIATAFVESLESMDASSRARALESSASSMEFTKLVREKGLLTKWEEFRVDHALRLFTDRLASAGAEALAVSRWADILRSSQQQARSRRSQQAAASPVQRPPRSAHREGTRDEIPDARAVAMKAMEFLSDSEISGLSLPLGSVMRALGALLNRS